MRLAAAVAQLVWLPVQRAAGWPPTPSAAIPRSAPLRSAPWRVPAPGPMPWLPGSVLVRQAQAVPQLPATRRSPSVPQEVALVEVAARSPCRTARATRLAKTGRQWAPTRPDVPRWHGPRSARWRDWPTPHDPVARVSAAPSPGSDRVDRRQEAAVAVRRSCLPAGRATNSPGSSTPGTRNIPTASERARLGSLP
jgi:hypothetical protein